MSVSEDDYPTGPIDIWPLLAEDAPAEAFVVDANGALHGKGNGRFVKPPPPARLSVLRTFGEGEDTRQIPVRVFTWAEVSAMSPDDPDGPNVFELPDEPGVEWETTKFAPGVYTSKPTHSETHVKLAPRPRKPVETPPDTAIIRSWAIKQEFPVSTKGKLPQAVVDAYMKAHRGG